MHMQIVRSRILTGAARACVQKQHIVEDVQRLLHLYKVRNTLVSDLTKQPGGLKRLRWRLSLGMELVASPSLLIVDGICEGGVPLKRTHVQILIISSQQHLTQVNIRA